MNDIVLKYDFLSESEFNFLNKVCEKFTPTQTPEDNKHYYKQTIEDYSELKSFLEKAKEEIVKFNKKVNQKLLIGEIWINKVTPETNRTDKLHLDKDELTSVTFLNDNFVGGDLEIRSDGIFNIKPKKGTTLFFNGAKIAHRVLPVTDGERYTLVIFWQWNSKKNKSLF